MSARRKVACSAGGGDGAQIARDASDAALSRGHVPGISQTLVIAPLFKNVVDVVGECAGDNARSQRPRPAEATHFQPGNVRPRLKGPPGLFISRAHRPPKDTDVISLLRTTIS